MEKDKNKLEKKDDSNDDVEDDNSGDSKSTNTKNIETRKHYSKDIEEKKGIKTSKESKFFQKKDSNEDDVSEKNEATESINTTEEDPGLSEEELHEATLAIIDSLTQEVAEELETVAPDSPEEFEALADAIFLDELLDVAEGDSDITEGSIDLAFTESLADLDIDNDVDTSDVNNNYTENSLGKIDLNSDIDLVDDGSNETEDVIQPDSEQLSNSSSTPPTSTAPGGVNAPHSPSQQASNTNYSHANTAPQVRTETRNVEIIHGRRSDMLVGAVIGYIVGRRGGRKRTEKKLQPRVSKLEEQVTELHYKIVNKEAQLRNLARQKAESHENFNRSENNNKSLTEEVVEQRKIKKEVKEKLKTREELAKDPGVEKIGKFSLPALKVFHERRIPDGSENSPKRKQVEVMNESELLEQIGDLRIEGYEVKKIYLNGRLELNSLRQITKEFLRGGPYKQTFIKELLRDKNEIDKSREAVNSIDSKSTKNLNNVSKNISMENETLTKEEAEKRAEALIMTHTEMTSKPKSNRVLVASFTLLIVIVSVFMILLLS